MNPERAKRREDRFATLPEMDPSLKKMPIKAGPRASQVPLRSPICYNVTKNRGKQDSTEKQDFALTKEKKNPQT